MKKYLILLMMFVMLGTALFGFIGCWDDKFIEDGDFEYFYMKSEKCYTIVGTTKQGMEKKTLYVPSHFRGKEVRYTLYQKMGLYGSVGRYHLDVGHKTENIYFSYLHQLKQGVFYESSYNPRRQFFANNDTDYGLNVCGHIFQENWHTRYSSIGFVTKKTFEIAIEEMKSPDSIYTSFELIGDYIVQYYEALFKEQVATLQVANTSYLFNYEGAPNGGYYFINDFERGALIENTPYEPQRKGYTFAGWYKESECRNIWDFTKNTLPEAEYDEQGNLIFTETMLYAKWTKK